MDALMSLSGGRGSGAGGGHKPTSGMMSFSSFGGSSAFHKSGSDDGGKADLAETLKLLESLSSLSKSLSSSSSGFSKLSSSSLGNSTDEDYGFGDYMNINGTDYDDFSSNVTFLNGSNGNSWNSLGTDETQPKLNLTELLSLFNQTGSLFGSREPKNIDLNANYEHSLALVLISNLVLIAFIYYVPRMIYFRLTRFFRDKEAPCFFPILFLSLIACAGAGIHLFAFQYKLSTEPILSFFTGVQEKKLTSFIYTALKASVNRVVDPVIAVVCLQQIASHTEFKIPFLRSSILHAFLCLSSIAAVFGYTFYYEHKRQENFEENTLSFFRTSPAYPDAIHVDYYDFVAPFITIVLFFYAKRTISRQSLYSAEKYGPNGPRILDRVSKVVIYETIMLIPRVIAFLLAPSQEAEKAMSKEASTWFIFFLTAQTPFIHFVLLRSLLRSRKPTRLCFLLCCSYEEKISDGETKFESDKQMNPPVVKEVKEKEEEDEGNEGKEEKTNETLDHHKIIVEEVKN